MPFPLLCIYFGKLVDDLNSSACIDEPPASLEDMVRRKVIIVALFAVANFATIYVYMGCWTLFGERIVRRLRTRYLTALLRQEAAYFDTLPAGEVAARLDSDLHTIQQGVSEKVGIYIASVSNFLTAYAVAFVMDSKLALILFVLVPAYYAMVHVGKYFSEKYSKQVNEAVGEASSLAAESLSNIQVVQAFRLESRLEAIFAGHLLKVQPAAIRKFVAAAIQLGFLFFVAHAANSTAVWMGSKQIAESIVADTGFTFGRVYTCLLVMINGERRRYGCLGCQLTIRSLVHVDASFPVPHHVLLRCSRVHEAPRDDRPPFSDRWDLGLPGPHPLEFQRRNRVP